MHTSWKYWAVERCPTHTTAAVSGDCLPWKAGYRKYINTRSSTTSRKYTLTNINSNIDIFILVSHIHSHLQIDIINDNICRHKHIHQELHSSLVWLSVCAGDQRRIRPKISMTTNPKLPNRQYVWRLSVRQRIIGRHVIDYRYIKKPHQISYFPTISKDKELWQKLNNLHYSLYKTSINYVQLDFHTQWKLRSTIGS